MRTAAAAALSFAGLIACAGSYTPGTFYPSDSGGTGIGGSGDGGPDGGRDGGDAGPDGGSDAGCTALALGSAFIRDTCTAGVPITGVGSVSVNTASCTVNITSDTGFGACTGTVTGVRDAFNGNCGSFSPCYSTSLPGTITCVISATSSCSISVCDGGC
jgi:hypothetical protein